MMKKYYIPGMFSIILLPMMCMWYFGYINTYKTYGAINVYFPEIGPCTLYSEVPFDEINFTVFELNSTLSGDAVVVQNIVETIDRLEDQKEGVKIVLGKNMEYSSYIRILELLLTKRGETLLFSDEILFINEIYHNKHLEFFDNIEIIDPLTNEVIPELQRNRTKEFLEQIGDKKYLIYGGYILLLFFAFRDYNRKIRRNKKE
ncbi:hypothetical protein HX071_07095 [Myroides marinus]|uniref:hypothetical protein n=1 Tax=Myroides marinus TaxID=703342 RepID=UPI0025774941|nr:hypothetical protein [Myroides marinus]MDM1501967.1 hypothetical protein [Myroides marinus]